MSPLTEPTRIVMAKGQSVANDPYLYTNTVLLLHGNGANGSTNIVDSSRVAGGPKTIAVVGDAKISTVQSKFGGGSIALDGNGDYLLSPLSSDLSFPGNFTVESWIYLTALNALNNASYITDFRSGGSNNFTLGVINSGGNGRLYAFSSGADVTGSMNVSLNTWNHVSFVRNGSVLTLYLNGAACGTLSTSFSQSSTGLYIGSRFTGLTEYVSGYLNDLRITKGIARYTSNFTPPTAPFPDF